MQLEEFFQKMNNNFETLIFQMNRNFASVEEQFGKIQNQMDDLQEGQSNLKHQVNDLQKGQEGLQAQVNDLQNKVGKLEEGQKGLQVQVNSLQNKVSKLEKGQKELKKGQQDLQIQIKIVDEKVDKGIQKVEDKLDVIMQHNLPLMLNEQRRMHDLLNKAIYDNQVEHQGLDHRISQLEIS